MDNLKIDLGCGACKKEGTIGIDIEPHSCVDHVLDIQKEALPFADSSVKYVHSYHFLEHIDNPLLVFPELSRVCKDGAELEFWTPYGWSNPAFIFSHKIFYHEEHYLHLCVWDHDQFIPYRPAIRDCHYECDSPITSGSLISLAAAKAISPPRNEHF